MSSFAVMPLGRVHIVTVPCVLPGAVDPGEHARQVAELVVGREVDHHADDAILAEPDDRVSPVRRRALSGDQRHRPLPVALGVGIAFAICTPSFAAVPSNFEREE
ncbi:uncharacterized protein SOCE836_098840 [Sorangium cellulosum]|uniref:Uncharacterized protein n=1 Tax=Sorangium cellulosum TaxID=56 RepID=A0A4P2R3L7_SORCE|nr:uncharacterized protein SOCE836_098840 [Sorangium cellulosum]WCQ96944.1 hypothetical protein NQZ70_09734 [Sorangium sp. Soce836]